MLSSQVPPKETVGLAQLVESTRFTRLWLTEDYYRKAGFASCGAVLGSTSTLSVGLGVTSIYLRHPTVLAMEIATLHRMFSGRFEVGLGLGSPRALNGSGRMPESKIDSVRDRLSLIADLVAGEQVTWADDLDEVGEARLQYPGDIDAVTWLGAEGPQMLALARDSAGGVIFSAFSTPVYLDWAMATLKTCDSYPTVLYLHVSVHEDVNIAAEAARNILIGRIKAGYVSSSMRRSGYWNVIEPLLGAPADVIEPWLTEEVVSAFIVFGTPDQCRQKLRAFEDTGVDEIALAPNINNDPTRLGEAITMLSGVLVGT
ncbi:MAG: LLM class flavin-dependent oxidoreductase [Actinomycetota bacterium]|nr:LLM class flavin-dependent oxidoreductase [Actinomycetota bacterium]MDG2119531.1 LLM class flavin-dependent oxidoreductase [Actinomycetota bacterium]